MSNQTLVHNMRCQNQLQWGRTGNQEKKEGNATSHTSRVHTEFTQNGGGAFETHRSTVWL